MAAADDDALFRLPPVEETDAVQKEEPGPVEKSFRPYDPNQVLLLPPSLEEWLPERHLARFVSELVEEALDLSAIRAAYTEERGYPPYDPRLMVKLLIYGYCTGQRSSRVIEKRCWDDVGFRYLAAGAAPDYRSIARFRRRHLEGAGRPLPAGTAAMPTGGDGAAGQGGTGRDQAAGERQPAQGHELQADGGA